MSPRHEIAMSRPAEPMRVAALGSATTVALLDCVAGVVAELGPGAHDACSQAPIWLWRYQVMVLGAHDGLLAGTYIVMAQYSLGLGCPRRPARRHLYSYGPGCPRRPARRNLYNYGPGCPRRAWALQFDMDRDGLLTLDELHRTLASLNVRLYDGEVMGAVEQSRP